MGSRYDYHKVGSEIYRESFAIIRREAALERFPADVEPVIVRMIHASGQIDLADDVAFTPGIASYARLALASGAPILCDSTMVATGIIRSRLPADNEVICRLGDPELARIAEEVGTTKTAAAVDLWADRLDGSVVAIGNAPTALFRLLDMMAETGLRPAAVIGIPVGFVGAVEAKEALIGAQLGLEYLTVRGRRGGSAVTAAALNALAGPAE